MHPLLHRYLVQFLASGDVSETSKLYWRSWGYSFSDEKYLVNVCKQKGGFGDVISYSANNLKIGYPI